MLARTVLSRNLVAAPSSVRFVSTAVRKATPPATAAATSSKATITTTASSIANPGPSSTQAQQLVSESGRLKSSHRHYHKNGSESSSGLNDTLLLDAERIQKQILRMRDAKELAGIV